MNPGVTATLVHVVAGSFICVPCFRRLEGVIKLRYQLAEREKKIADDLPWKRFYFTACFSQDLTLKSLSPQLSAVLLLLRE